MSTSRYNPDNIEQAKRDLSEQRQFETATQEALREVPDVVAVAALADRPALEEPTFSLESRLGPPDTLIVRDGVLCRATHRRTETNEDCGLSYLAQYRPVEPQNKAMALYQQARVIRRYNPQDPMQWRIEKWLEFDVDVPVPMPSGFDPLQAGYVQLHRFRHGNVVYRANDKLLLTFVSFGVCTYHLIKLSDIAIQQEQILSLDFAVACAIQADLEYRKAQEAECELLHLLGMGNDDSISW